MFGLRQTETDAGGKKTRSGLVTFFEDGAQSQKNRSASSREENSFEEVDKTESGRRSRVDIGSGTALRTNERSRTAGASQPNRAVGAGFGVTDGSFDPTSNARRMADFTDSGQETFFGRAREQQAASDDFRRLLATPSGINPLTPGFDPINFNVDTTRRELDPVTPVGPNSALSGSSAGSLDSLRALAGPPSRSGLTGIEDSSSTRVLGPSSLSPAVAAPVEPRYSQPSPVVLEFPKRKF